MTRRIRLPSPHQLAAQPPLGLLLVLQVVVHLAATALRAWHPAADGDPWPDEDDEVSSARTLLRDCRRLDLDLSTYHRRIPARLRRQQHQTSPR